MATNPASDVDFWGDSIHPSQPHSSDSEPDDYDNAYPRDAHEDTCHVADEDDARPQRRRHRAPSASGSTSSEPDSDGDSEQDYSFPTSVSATPTLIADEVLPPGTGQAIQNLDDVIRSINHALHLKALPPSSIPPTAAQIHKYLAQSGEKVVDAVRKSLFDGGTQVLVFPKLGQRVTLLPASMRSALTWKISGYTPKVVRAAVARANFALVRKGKTWMGCWGKHFTPERFKKVHPWQKVNHFPMSFEIGRKDKLLANYHRLRASCGPEAFTYLPETYIHPRQKTALLRAFPSHALWILKPPASARGQGIRVINSTAQLTKKKHPVIVSRYIAKPFLIGGRKFDLRLYVAVTSFEPLRIYLYRDGVVRFAGEKYSTSSKSIRNRYIHLTNYSISRRSKAAAAAEPALPGSVENDCLLGDPRFSASASKWSFRALQDYFAETGVDFEPVYAQIRDLVVKTIISAHASNASGTRMYSRGRTSCYELFGFDVLLDARLKPWLMEVNISPSLKASCDMDFAIKFELVTDLLNLVGFRVEDVRRCRDSNGDEPRKDDKRPNSWADRSRHKALSYGGRAAWLSNLTEDDLKALEEVEDENHRRGDFARLFPAQNTAPYLALFNSLPFIDRLLHHWTCNTPDDAARVTALRGLRARATAAAAAAPVSLPDLCRPPLAPPEWSGATGLRQVRSTSSLGPLRTEKRPAADARAATSLQRRAVSLVDSSSSSSTPTTTGGGLDDPASAAGRRHDSGYVGSSQALQPASYGCLATRRGSVTPPPPHRSQSCVPRRSGAAASSELVKVRHISLGLDRIVARDGGGSSADKGQVNPQHHPRRSSAGENRLQPSGTAAAAGAGRSAAPQGIFPYWPASRGSSPSLRTRMEKRAHLAASTLGTL